MSFAIPPATPVEYPVAVTGQNTAPTSTALTLTAPKPVVRATRDMVKITEIAAHDSELADCLRHRLDFSHVVNGGLRLSRGDALGVLSPREYARFEIIANAVKTAHNSKVFTLASAATTWLIGAGGTLGAFFVDPGLGVVAALGSIFGGAAITDHLTKTKNRCTTAAIDGIAPTLAALPAPTSEQS